MPPRATLRSLLLLVAVGVGCSGGSAESGGQGGAGARPPAVRAGQREAERRAESERNLRAAQESAVEAMCERLADCAVESARENMTPEEVAQLDVENTAPRLREECESEYGRTQLSPRQVRVVQRCVTETRACDELQTCLEDARRPSSP
jgi:hypothetical protein